MSEVERALPVVLHPRKLRKDGKALSGSRAGMALLAESPEQRELPLGGEVREADGEVFPAQTEDRA